MLRCPSMTSDECRSRAEEAQTLAAQTQDEWERELFHASSVERGADGKARVRPSPLPTVCNAAAVHDANDLDCSLAGRSDRAIRRRAATARNNWFPRFATALPRGRYSSGSAAALRHMDLEHDHVAFAERHFR